MPSAADPGGRAGESRRRSDGGGSGCGGQHDGRDWVPIRVSEVSTTVREKNVHVGAKCRSYGLQFFGVVVPGVLPDSHGLVCAHGVYFEVRR